MQRCAPTFEPYQPKLTFQAISVFVHFLACWNVYLTLSLFQSVTLIALCTLAKFVVLCAKIRDRKTAINTHVPPLWTNQANLIVPIPCSASFIIRTFFVEGIPHTLTSLKNISFITFWAFSFFVVISTFVRYGKTTLVSHVPSLRAL